MDEEQEFDQWLGADAQADFADGAMQAWAEQEKRKRKLAEENADLRRQRDAWQEDARLRATNSDYWRERAKTAERQLKALETELEDLNNAFCAEERLRISLEKSRRNEDVAPSDRRNNEACNDCATRWSQRLEGVETEYPCPQHKLTSAQQEKL